MVANNVKYARFHFSSTPPSPRHRIFLYANRINHFALHFMPPQSLLALRRSFIYGTFHNINLSDDPCVTERGCCCSRKENKRPFLPQFDSNYYYNCSIRTFVVIKRVLCRSVLPDDHLVILGTCLTSHFFGVIPSGEARHLWFMIIILFPCTASC